MSARRRRRAPALRIVIVGFGRMGGSLALKLKARRVDVAALPRSTDSVRRAVAAGIRLADHDDLRAATVCFLAVPDASVASVAQLVEEDLGPDTGLVHLSGALSLSVLAPAAAHRPCGSFHPLVAVSDPRDVLAGSSVALAVTDEGLRRQLVALAELLGLSPIEVPESGRAAYHAGAVLSAGLLVALADAATSTLVHAGLERDQATRALLPLMRSALSGIEARGIERAATGPVVRGDVQVVQSHLDALPPEIGSVYRLLSRRLLRLVATLPEETRAALERVLA